MILILIKFVHAMVLDIHGVNKGNKFLLSNYSLTYQLFFINLLAAFIGFVSLLIFNFYLIQSDRIILEEYENALLQTNKIKNFLSNNSIKRIPLFNENCETINSNQECEINVSEPVLDPTITQNFVMQNFLNTKLDVIVYNDDWIKFADTNDMYVNTEVVEIDINAKMENSYNFIEKYRSFYINFFNQLRINFIKNKYINISKNLGSEINIVSETIKTKEIVKDKYRNKDQDIFQIISSPILYNNRVFGFKNLTPSLIKDELPPQHGNQNLEGTERVRDILVTSGMDEIITYSIIDPLDEARLRMEINTDLDGFIPVKNPLSQERSHLRRSLLPGALISARTNLRFLDKVNTFEVGRVFHPQKGKILPNDPQRLSFLMSGVRLTNSWLNQDEGYYDFFDLKGV